jgi:hypothetical protein
MTAAPTAPRAARDARKWCPHSKRSTECGRAEVGGMSTLTTGLAEQQHARPARGGGPDQPAWSSAALLALLAPRRGNLIATQPASDRPAALCCSSSASVHGHTFPETTVRPLGLGGPGRSDGGEDRGSAALTPVCRPADS